jgi:hypothetical protein
LADICMAAAYATARGVRCHGALAGAEEISTVGISASSALDEQSAV